MIKSKPSETSIQSLPKSSLCFFTKINKLIIKEHNSQSNVNYITIINNITINSSKPKKNNNKFCLRLSYNKLKNSNSTISLFNLIKKIKKDKSNELALSSNKRFISNYASKKKEIISKT